MNKLVIEVNLASELRENDLIHYNKEKKRWESIHYVDFNIGLFKRQKELENQVKDLENQLCNLKNSINDKLEEYHNILQVLTKEN